MTILLSKIRWLCEIAARVIHRVAADRQLVFGLFAQALADKARFAFCIAIARL
jgi:hypothetical protein